MKYQRFVMSFIQLYEGRDKSRIWQGNVLEIHPIVIEIFQTGAKWFAKRHSLPSKGATLLKSNDKIPKQENV